MIHEIFEKVSNQKTTVDKISVLHEHNSMPLRDILRGSFDSTVSWNLPAGAPPFKVDDAPIGYNFSNILHACKKLKYFAHGGPGDKLKQVKRERMFVEMLESVHPKDAQIIIWMKDAQLAGKYKGVTKKLVKDAFPRLIQEK